MDKPKTKNVQEVTCPALEGEDRAKGHFTISYVTRVADPGPDALTTTELIYNGATFSPQMPGCNLTWPFCHVTHVKNTAFDSQLLATCNDLKARH